MAAIRSSGPRKRWSPKEEAQLIKLADVHGINHKKIAVILGRTLASVTMRLSKVRMRGLPPVGESPFIIWMAAMARLDEHEKARGKL